MPLVQLGGLPASNVDALAMDLPNLSSALGRSISRVLGYSPLKYNPTVVFFGKGMGMDQEPWDLRIGNAFLKDFVGTLDYLHGQITLTAP